MAQLNLDWCYFEWSIAMWDQCSYSLLSHVNERLHSFFFFRNLFSLSWQRENKSLGIMSQGCNSNTWEAKAGRSEVQSQSWLHSEFKASLGYRKPCLKWQRRQQRIKRYVIVPGNQLFLAWKHSLLGIFSYGNVKNLLSSHLASRTMILGPYVWLYSRKSQ